MWARVKIMLLLPFLFLACGGSSGGTDAEDDSGDTVNTEKLIGTPFEGMETGDDLAWDTFLCGQYRTETIDELPIKIFTAFFTEAQEAIIQEGIAIANEAMGIEAYVLTDEWRDDLRVIYKVMEIADGDVTLPLAGGVTLPLYFDFNNKTWAEQIALDWGVELRTWDVTEWNVAHELGHTSGIAEHMKIDYENDELLELEENSLMSGNVWLGNPALDDYNFMMTTQAEFIQAHLGENGRLELERCGGNF